MAFDSISRAEVARTGNVRHLPFRTDIEGLRAIAILLVVGAHARLPWLAGGYVGVDVFFVLSGYLITGLLLDEFTRTGKIDFTAFYARRFQRLLPGLLLMIAVTSLTAMALLAPFEQVDQARAASAAIAWVSNLFFAFSRLDYFGSAAEASLFLHTWSLGVEEQFYLLWPALMLLLLKGWRIAPTRAKDGMRRLVAGMAVTAAACFVLSAFLTYAYPEHGFYMVYSRGWQFALGALVLLAARNYGSEQPRLGPTPWRAPLGWLGFAAILACAFLLDGYRPYPGFWAVLPSVGTLAILAAGQSGSERTSRVGHLLSCKPLQGIGRLSYAWYLWHWPVLLLGQSLFGTTLATNITLAAASLCLAAVSYRYVESPLRRASNLRTRPRLTLMLGTLAILVTLVGCREWKQSARLWERTPGQLPVGKIRHDRPIIYRMGCDGWYRTPRVKICRFGNAGAAHTAVLMGDSISGQWFPAIERIFVGAGWRLLVINKSSCPMVDEPVFYDRIGREYVECAQWRKSAIDSLKFLKPDVVLLSSLSVYPLSPLQWQQGTERVLRQMALGSARIGVLQPTPILPFDPVLCIDRRDWRTPIFKQLHPCSAPSTSAEQDQVRNALARAVAAVPTASMIDLTDAICPEGHCEANRTGMLVYRDDHHLTPRFVLELTGELNAALARHDLAPSENDSHN